MHFKNLKQKQHLRILSDGTTLNNYGLFVFVVAFNVNENGNMFSLNSLAVWCIVIKK